MASPDPSWRRKTRPCPFYQQGRCLFADNCNFVHTAMADGGHVAQHNMLATTPQIVPRVIIDSPQSARSPPRSPRTTSLLLALRDVIGDADEMPAGSSADSSIAEDTWSENLPTLVNPSGFGVFSESHLDQVDANNSFDSFSSSDDDEEVTEGTWTAISDYTDDLPSRSPERDDLPHENRASLVLDAENSTIRPLRPTIDSSLPSSPSGRGTQSSPIEDDQASDIASGLLSPIELSTINFGPLRDLDSQETNSFDSGYAEHWKPPSRLLVSPPRSPSISSTLGLLSSPFRNYSTAFSPRIGAFIPCSPASPARTISPASGQDDQPDDLSLDSPEKALDMEASPRQEHDATLSEGTDGQTGNLTMEEIDGKYDTSDDDEFWHDEASGELSVWDADGGPTAVYAGNDVAPESILLQVTEATVRMRQSPKDFLNANQILFEESEINHHSERKPDTADESTIDQSSNSTADQSIPDEEEDTNCSLAYLHSPPAPGRENDTLNSLYDIYSGVAPVRDVIADSLRNSGLSPPAAEPVPLSNSSTPASSLRERVFTPPPFPRKNSYPTNPDSPTSLASPITSLDSTPVVFSAPGNRPASSHGSGRQSPFSPSEGQSSRRVSFGFRSSFLGHPNNSSLLLGRQSLTNVPPPPSSGSRHESQAESPALIKSPPSVSSRRGLKPLRLSAVLNSQALSRPVSSRISAASTTSYRQSQNSSRASISSASVSSNHSLSHNALISSARSSDIPLPLRTNSSSSSYSPSPTSSSFRHHNVPQSAPPTSWRKPASFYRPSSRLSEPAYENYEEEEETMRSNMTDLQQHDAEDEPIRQSIRSIPHSAPPGPSNPAATRGPTSSLHALVTPRPTLMFAIASDDVKQVRRVLQSGEASPNEAVGPQSALEFALTNDKLINRLEIVKILLAYGADPTPIRNMEVPSASERLAEETSRDAGADEDQTVTPLPPPKKALMGMVDPATRYYVDRADASHTLRSSALIQRSFFRPLTRVRYEVIGQDRAFEQMFRVLGMHSRELSVAPIVMLLCGPSGHGKSLLARKFGALLDVPTHTVNMTTLRSTHDLWRSYSMSPYETPTTCTLAEFLINNEGKRCVVVLDEIEKTEDQKFLWSLLMPWELGRCTFEATSRHIDVRNVIWLGTSNIAEDLVFEHHEGRQNSEELMSREEYVQLMQQLRPKVSAKLGSSILSRLTTVLPFVPFTMDEKEAICSEVLHSVGGEAARGLSSETVATVISTAIAEYVPEEGARSLHRAISNQLIDLL